LSSVSHDLRTPLGVITGATSALLHDEEAQRENKKLNATTRRDLLDSAHEAARRLNRLVTEWGSDEESE
jgi:two-component system, OmpR family, sensor histidine kinase KdpD